MSAVSVPRQPPRGAAAARGVRRSRPAGRETSGHAEIR